MITHEEKRPYRDFEDFYSHYCKMHPPCIFRPTPVIKFLMRQGWYACLRNERIHEEMDNEMLPFEINRIKIDKVPADLMDVH